jgi:hypothetical protein
MQRHRFGHFIEYIQVEPTQVCSIDRFGKTISVSMFAAAMLYAAPACECSIYSTCKRISQKLLRNVCQFLELIYDALGVPKYKVIRANMEELVVQGPDGVQDRRVVNSYPSKVGLTS